MKELAEIKETLDKLQKELQESNQRAFKINTTANWVMEYLTITSLGVAFFTLCLILLGSL